MDVRVYNIMEKSMKEYTRWLSESVPLDLKKELEEIKDNPEEIYERFCRDMTFGTSGLRGKMGVGTCYINSIVLMRASMGIADYVLERRTHPALAISYDTRKNSRAYAFDVAQVFAARGIDVWIMEEAQPVPLLSFAVRHLGLSGGIMITASHNPKEYNGYKVYDHYGNQIDDDKARKIEGFIEKHDYFDAPRRTPGTSGKIYTVSQDTIDAYRKCIMDLAVQPADMKGESQLSVIYTPLNGTGIKHVPEILRNAGISKLHIVENQIEGDGNFTTCPFPNPEIKEAFAEAEKWQADIIVATDPDCDRMGAEVWNGSEYVLLSGNQMGELMFDYLCICYGGKEKKGLEGKRVYKSLVSSPLVESMAAPYGVIVENTLTGFKNIALKMEKLAEEGCEDSFFFGFEESIGYLHGTYTRDKDGVIAAQLACLTASYWKSQGINLLERLEQIRMEYGFSETRSWSLYFKREKDRATIAAMMKALLEHKLTEVAGWQVDADMSLAKDNIYQGKIQCVDDSGRCCKHRFVVRPSGTELKLKTYVFAEGGTGKLAAETAEKLSKALQEWLLKLKEEIQIYE